MPIGVAARLHVPSDALGPGGIDFWRVGHHNHRALPLLATAGRFCLLGGVPEWLKGTDCKSVGFAYAGSNPAPSTIREQKSGARDQAVRFLRPDPCPPATRV